MPAGIKKRDEGGEYAVTDSAESQPHAVRSNTAKDMAEREVFAGSDRDRAFPVGQDEAYGSDEHGEEADGSQTPLLVEDDAERRTERHGSVGADAVEGDDFGGAVLSGAGDAPKSGACGAETFSDAEHETAKNKNNEAKPVGAVQDGGTYEQSSAGGAGSHTPEDRNFSTGAVRDSTGPGTASERGDVLDADDQPGQHRAVSHAEMDIRRQNGERQADGEIADESEIYEAENVPGSTPDGGGGWARSA